MNISYNWLKRFVNVSESPAELAAILTSLGLECDTVHEVESIRGGLRGVVIGKVLTCIEHPNSDHLNITTCDLGGDEPVQIVCGAPNVSARQTVVVATVGTTLYDGDKEFKIKKSKIRGVESFGMICAEDELGLGTSHDGIMVLTNDVAPGTPAAEYFRLQSDWCLEVELTPNRVDAASHLGVARDYKAWLLRRQYQGELTDRIADVTLPDAQTFSHDTSHAAQSIEVLDTEGCPRYAGITLRGCKVAPSPEWLQRLLISAGQRPINNIVDITNYILLGIGQPLHCFDLAHVQGDTIYVRTCPEGTPFTTLDGVERKLSSADLMICDADKPLCIAGVYGGLNSGVTESTTDIFIESAYFNPTRIRRTARRHGLSTDASFRYERGTDPNILPYAARLAAVMVRDLAGGEICGDILDTRPHGFDDNEIVLSLDYCHRLIGQEIPRELIILILRALEIEVKDGPDADTLQLRVPRYRVDVTRPCDIVEEILRVYGYNNIEFGMEMQATLSQKQRPDLSHELQERVSERLTGLGYNEILNNSLTSRDYYTDNALYPPEQCVPLLNPLSRDLGVMRRTLLYGGLETIRHNSNRKATDLRLYEFGKVYSMLPDRTSTDDKPLAPYHEHNAIAIWLTGLQQAASWNVAARQADIYDLKAIVYDILHSMGIDTELLKTTQSADFVCSARLLIATGSGREIGSIGILRHALTHRFDIEADVFYAEFNWDTLVSLAATVKIEYTPLPRTMPVRRDLALLLDKNITFDDILKVIRKSGSKLLRDVRLFDVYEGKNIPQDKKSYALSITIQDNERTLNDKQIDAVMSKITSNLQHQLGAQLR